MHNCEQWKPSSFQRVCVWVLDAVFFLTQSSLCFFFPFQFNWVVVCFLHLRLSHQACIEPLSGRCYWLLQANALEQSLLTGCWMSMWNNQITRSFLKTSSKRRRFVRSFSPFGGLLGEQIEVKVQCNPHFALHPNFQKREEHTLPVLQLHPRTSHNGICVNDSRQHQSKCTLIVFSKKISGYRVWRPKNCNLHQPSYGMHGVCKMKYLIWDTTTTNLWAQNFIK